MLTPYHADHHTITDNVPLANQPLLTWYLYEHRIQNIGLSYTRTILKLRSFTNAYNSRAYISDGRLLYEVVRSYTNSQR